MPWKVPTHMALPGTPNNFSMRPRISCAALLVKVTARMECGEAPSVAITQAMRCVSTRVLPEPAPASTSTGPTGAVTAARCASFRESRIGEVSIGAANFIHSRAPKGCNRAPARRGLVLPRLVRRDHLLVEVTEDGRDQREEHGTHDD